LNLQLTSIGGTFGDFSFEDTDYDWNDYHSQMYYLILTRWYNRLYVMLPLFERWAFQKRVQGLKGSVLIRFVIERSGTVSSIDVLEPSPMPPLDESARSALKEVILPRLPDDFKKDREAVTGRFLLDIDDVGYWHREMMVLKDAGKF
jgi:TonB family protein